MQAGIYIVMTRDVVQRNIPYAVVAEVMGGARWNTGKRKRLMKEQFTEDEMDAANRLYATAMRWLYHGVPGEVKMTGRTLALWHKLAAFCRQL